NRRSNKVRHAENAKTYNLPVRQNKTLLFITKVLPFRQNIYADFCRRSLTYGYENLALRAFRYNVRQSIFYQLSIN
ncbi:MAG: hypothetical protein LBV75_01500, partial [Paludibacter sp.]|nr:hypothetical protein [Paludibacter sp.]